MVAPGGLPDSARSSREVIRKGTGDRPAAGDRRRGAVGGGAVPGVLRGADREREDAGGVRAGGGAVPRVVRGAGPPAARRLAAPRGRLLAMTVVTTRLSGRTFNTQEMRTVIPRIGPRGPAPCAAEAVFAETKAFLASREARQMSEGDLERELHRRRQELVRKLLQEHRGQPSPREAAGPVEGPSAGECSERREHERHTETTSRTVQIPRPGCAPRGHDGLHPLAAALNLPLPRYRVEVRRRMTIATASRAPPRTPLQFTALDIIHTGRLVPAATWRAAPVAGSIGRGLSALVRSIGARARVHLGGLAVLRGTAQSSLTA